MKSSDDLDSSGRAHVATDPCEMDSNGGHGPSEEEKIVFVRYFAASHGVRALDSASALAWSARGNVSPKGKA